MMKGLFQLFALSSYVPFLDASLISRVAIIGGGPGGLALAASLRNLNAGVADIVVYESRADIASTTVGGGVQLSGGAKMLKLLGILPDLEGCAEKVANVVGRNTHGSKVLGINLNRFKTKNSDSNSDILRTEEGAPLLFSIMRSSLQKILFKATQTPSVESNSSIHVQLNSSIKGIAQEENQKYSVHLKDGTVGSDFDMVFGCDGVNSVIREYIYCSQSPHCLLEDSNCVLNPLLIPHYNGLRVGFVLTKVDSAFNVRPDARGLFRIWLGDGVFGLEGSFGSFEGPQHMLALMYRDNRHASVGTNTEWSANSLLEFYQKKLNESGLNKVVEIQNLMNAADSSRCVDIGLKEATIPLPTWSSGDGRVILMGDSAHAIAPFLGQGVNQAMQDAYVIANGIKKINTKNSEKTLQAALKKFAKNYELRRMPATYMLRLMSYFLGRLNTLGGPLVILKESVFRLTNFIGFFVMVM